MKFRIVEIKDSHCRPLFKPQRKQWLFWRNISNTHFAETIFMKTKLEYRFGECTDSISKAQQVIDEYKLYLESNKTYTKIHNIE